MPKASNTEEFIEKAKKIHGNKYDYSKVKYKNNHTKIIIICSIHGEFLQTPNNHLQGYGCRKCGVKNLTTEEFIERAKKVHGNKYDYSKVKYIHSLTDVIIICYIHGEFLQTPNNHFGGAGCQKCAGSCRLSTEEFIKRATKIHNNKYDYSNTNFINVSEKVAIICKKHGEFTQTPHSHLKGNGCKQCANNALEKTTEEFIEQAKKIHGDKYNYSKVKYINANKKIIIICKKHGEFLQKPNNHLNSKGCSKCGLKSLTTEEFIEKANKIHKNKYDYSNTKFSHVNRKVIIVCPIHGEFLQTPHSHLKGYGCRKCCKSVSKPSQKWLDSLNIPVEYREQSLKIGRKNYRVDALCNNVVYEFYGDFWHGNLNRYDATDINKVIKHTFGFLYKKTMDREIEIKNSGYKIISIWESDFDG